MYLSNITFILSCAAIDFLFSVGLRKDIGTWYTYVAGCINILTAVAVAREVVKLL